MFKSERVFDDNLLLSYFDDGYISDRIAIKDSEIHVWFLDIGNYDEYHMKSLFDILTLDEKAKMSHYVQGLCRSHSIIIKPAGLDESRDLRMHRALLPVGTMPEFIII